MSPTLFTLLICLNFALAQVKKSKENFKEVTHKVTQGLAKSIAWDGEGETCLIERYGKSLDYYVNKQFSEKLKADPPLKDMKLQLLQEIAAESGLEWDAKALENKLFNESAYAKNRVDGSAQAHLFHGGDVAEKEIFSFLQEVLEKMKTVGYVPDTSCSLHDVSEEEKECSLMTHSEKVAVAFGMINMGSGEVLRVMKNLGDCHNAIKFVSKVYEREIVVRDVNRFHHFKEGRCSCGDYW